MFTRELNNSWKLNNAGNGVVKLIASYVDEYQELGKSKKRPQKFYNLHLSLEEKNKQLEEQVKRCQSHMKLFNDEIRMHLGLESLNEAVCKSCSLVLSKNRKHALDVYSIKGEWFCEFCYGK